MCYIKPFYRLKYKLDLQKWYFGYHFQTRLICKAKEVYGQRGCQLITLGQWAGERAVCSPYEQCNKLNRSLFKSLNISMVIFLIQKLAHYGWYLKSHASLG